MSLKQLIRRKKILEAIKDPGIPILEMPGEPLIYSIKSTVGQRIEYLDYFRNKQWRSILKCYFRNYLKAYTPTAIIVKFYVSPPVGHEISAAMLRREVVPAVYAFELCDYFISFLEMLHKVIIHNYRQVCRVDMVKLYSNNPRTTLQFMHYEEYVDVQNTHTTKAQAKSKRAARVQGSLQPELSGNEEAAGLCESKPA